MFLKRENSTYQADKYLKLINSDELKNLESIDDSMNILSEVYNYFYQYEIMQLKIIRTEVVSLVEDYKQSSLMTSMISTIVAISVLLLNNMKDFLLVDKSNMIMNVMFFLTALIISAIVLFPSIQMIGNFAKKSKTHIQILGILDLVINAKEELESKLIKKD
ncbi:hypothetical protein AMS62_19665 [Bacillus sp. FJAT-18019]|nr:hypothetical protein AMS62_19665 [Bacillus sp. FJAT-18019]